MFFQANDQKKACKLNTVHVRWNVWPLDILQGTILGLLLTFIFTSQRPDVVNSSALLCLDDTKTCRFVNSKNDSLELLTDLVLIEEWAVNNRLVLNLSKCHVMKILHHLTQCHHTITLSIESAPGRLFKN